MPKLIVLYPQPADAGEFERRYAAEHMPLVRANLPSAKKTVTARILGTPDGPAPYYRIAELHFDSADAMQAAMSSTGGQQIVAHAMEISTGGAPLAMIAEDDAPA